MRIAVGTVKTGFYNRPRERKNEIGLILYTYCRIYTWEFSFQGEGNGSRIIRRSDNPMSDGEKDALPFDNERA